VWGKVRSGTLLAALAVVSAAITLAALPAGASAQATYNLSRVAANITNLGTAEDLALMGYHVTCVGDDDGGPLSPTTSDPGDWVSPEALNLFKGVQTYGNAAPDAQAGLEALAACKPTVIFTDGDNPAGVPNEAAIAPTIDVLTGACSHFAGVGYETCSGWKQSLIDTGEAVGPAGFERAATVLANFDRRTATVRGQLAGVKFADAFVGPGSFGLDSPNGYAAGMFELDLGLKNIVTTLNGPLDSDEFSDEDIPQKLTSAQLIILYEEAGASAVNLFEDNGLWKALPAVKEGYVVESPSYNYNAGAADLDWLYAQIEKTFKINNYYAKLSGGSKANLTFRPNNRRVCWAVSPSAGGKLPTSPVSVKLVDAKTTATVTLARKPTYANPEADDPVGTGNETWSTTPATYETTGCVTLSRARVKLWLAKGPKSTLGFGGKTAALASGEASIAYASGSTVTKR
jgi:ABC-type Fe3+-hydroxamate transport system substrate-binding protein